MDFKAIFFQQWKEMAMIVQSFGSVLLHCLAEVEGFCFGVFKTVLRATVNSNLFVRIMSRVLSGTGEWNTTVSFLPGMS
jgi:hypothetical protein